MFPGSPLSTDSPISTPCSRELPHMENSRSQFSLFSHTERKLVFFSGTCWVWSTPSTGSLASTADLTTPILIFCCGRKRSVIVHKLGCEIQIRIGIEGELHYIGPFDLGFPFLGEVGLLNGKCRLPGERKGEVQRLDGNG